MINPTPLSKGKLKKCIDCGKSLIYSHGNALRCGNERKKTGCAYKAYIKRNKKWKKDVGYDKRPKRAKKMREYGRKYDNLKRT